nr:Phox domain-containing protein [Ipomoea batatas]
MEAYPNLYWMSCAAHCINLMLKDIFEIRHFSMAYKRALKLSVYIHSKTKLLNRLRKYTGKCDLVKFAKTRFATAFLTFKRLHEQKNNLRKLFNSKEFFTSSYFKEEAGKECSRIVQIKCQTFGIQF